VASGSRWLVPCGAGGYGDREEEDKRRGLKKNENKWVSHKGVETFHITILTL
jgi:hypothetical protein